jgi:soluble lytic murein transglycosylase-like protein
VEDAISRIASQEGINRNVFERLIYNESRGNPYVGMDSSNYSAGIGQVSRVVWKTYSKLPYNEASNPMNYEHNMRVAARYLKDNYKRFGNWRDALMAYNMGPTALEQVKMGKRSIPKITQNYVRGF